MCDRLGSAGMRARGLEGFDHPANHYLKGFTSFLIVLCVVNVFFLALRDGSRELGWGGLTAYPAATLKGLMF